MAFRNEDDVAALLVDTLDMVLGMTSEVYSICEWSIKKGFKIANEKLKAGEEKKEFDKDAFNLCTVAIDYGIIEIVSILLAVAWTAREPKIVLGADGSISMTSNSFSNAYTTDTTNVATPTPAFAQASMNMKIARCVKDSVDLLRKAGTGIADKVSAANTPPELEAY
jgi:hypothetical protein